MNINVELCRSVASDIHESFLIWYEDHKETITQARRERAERLCTNEFRFTLAGSIQEGLRVAKESKSRSNSRRIALVASTVMEAVKETLGSIYSVPPVTTLQVMAEAALTKDRRPSASNVNEFHGYETISVLSGMIR